MRNGDTLSTAQWAALQALFERVLQADPQDRDGLVEQASGQDPLIGEALAAMLGAHEQLQGRTASAVQDMQRQARQGTLLAPGETIGPYRILAPLGEGGFGAVYEAEQELPVRRRVALKVIKAGMDTGEVVARFKAERQALALMNHPHIARVFDAGATEAGRPYFVMELVQGEAISQYCQRHGLTIAERLELFDQVCAAVQHANANGVIHRDLKPNNVLVGDHDGKPFARIIDFGIAKAASGRLTDVTLLTERFGVMGTPAYMSPEQAEGRADIDARTDVYSLGVTLYELLTDTTPLDDKLLRAGGYAQVIRSIREIDPPLPSVRLMQAETGGPGDTGGRSTSRRRAAQVRGDLDWIVMKAIEKDPRRRYETVGEFAMDLRRHRAGQTVEAAPPSLSYRFGKIARRHRYPIAVGALLVAVVAITVLAVDRWSGRPGPASLAAASAPGKSVAVLPFENLSPDKDSAYFADGIQDTILSRLGGIAGLKVIARASTAGFGSHPANIGQVAAQVGVATILEGSVQKSGNQVLVNVQLIDARNGQHLWAQAYKRTLDNVFDVEGDIATSVADALDAKMTAAEAQAVKATPTRNPLAYDAYLRGLNLAAKGGDGASEASMAFAQAVHLDPGFALAWSWLSREQAWMVSSGEDTSAERKRKAREAMETVERLAPGSVESLIAQGYYQYRVEENFEKASQLFERAHALSRNDVETLWPLAMIVRRRGQWARCIALLEQAMSINPRDPLTADGAIRTYTAVRDFANAQRIVDRLNAFGSSVDPLSQQADIFLKKGDLDGLRKLLDQWPDSKPKSENDWFPEAYFILARDYRAGIAFLQAELPHAKSPALRGDIEAILGDAFRLAGDARSARASYQDARQLELGIVAADPGDILSLRLLGLVEAGLGDEKQALAYAKQAMEIDARLGDQSEVPADLEVQARIQARFGERDAAIASLRQLIATPYMDPITVAMLRLDPAWDSLRDDPRFKLLLQEHASDKPGP